MVVHSSFKTSSTTFFGYHHDFVVDVVHHDDASLQCIARNSRLSQSEEVNIVGGKASVKAASLP